MARLTPGAAALFGGAVLTALLALFWPQLEQAYASWHAARLLASGSAAFHSSRSTKCPLGYEGSSLPANHPPIRSSSSSTLVTFAGATIWTADAASPRATSMTVDLASGEVVQLSNDSSSSSTSRVMDMRGRFIMPAFVEPHAHLIPGGLSLARVNLRGLASGRQEMAARVAAAAAAAGPDSSSSHVEQPGGWLIGTGWSETDWPGAQLPDRSWIDEACGGRPTLLTRMDSHMALANTVALEAAGLMATAQEAAAAAGDAAAAAAIAAAEEAGLIDRDPATGLPTGLLRESAMHLVERFVPPPSAAERRAALAAAGSYLVSRGVTSVGDMGWGLFGPPSATWEDLEQVYDAAARDGSLPVRVSAYMPLRSWRRLASRVAVRGTFDAASGRLAWGGVKEFADGSLGSSTALMWEPYADLAAAAAAAAHAPDAASAAAAGQDECSVPHACGTRTIAADKLAALVRGAAAAGLQVAVHAIGDRAVDEVMDTFEGLGQQPQQHRLEHAQHLSSPAAAARMAALGLTAVPNPQHLLSDRPMLLRKLGGARAGPGRAFAFRTLAAAGVPLAFGSDWPVVEVDPWASVHAAVHRSDPPPPTPAAGSSSGSSSSGERPWEGEQERLALHEALLGHTLHAARAARLHHWVGALSLGRRGDFVVLDRDPFAQDGAGHGLPQVLQTFMDGVCVWGCSDSHGAA